MALDYPSVAVGVLIALPICGGYRAVYCRYVHGGRKGQEVIGWQNR